MLTKKFTVDVLVVKFNDVLSNSSPHPMKVRPDTVMSVRLTKESAVPSLHSIVVPPPSSPRRDTFSLPSTAMDCSNSKKLSQNITIVLLLLRRSDKASSFE